MKPRNYAFAAIVLLSLLLFSACSKEPSVEKYKVTKTPLPQANTMTAASPSGGSVTDTGLPFTWVTPASWTEGNPSSMRLASYNVPLSGGETGDFSLVQLGGGAGGTMANINRWRGQIGLGPATPEELAQVAHLHNTVQGQQYLHITLINPDNPGSAIAAGIFEQPGYVLFAKLTASAAGIDESMLDFEAFCNSISFKELQP